MMNQVILPESNKKQLRTIQNRKSSTIFIQLRVITVNSPFQNRRDTSRVFQRGTDPSFPQKHRQPEKEGKLICLFGPAKGAVRGILLLADIPYIPVQCHSPHPFPSETTYRHNSKQRTVLPAPQPKLLGRASSWAQS